VNAGYICPLCLNEFTQLRALSREHVPPKSIGGKVICLTCHDCNSTTGHQIDTHMHKERLYHSFMEKNGQTRKAILIKDGNQLNVEVRNDEQGINIKILGECNDPQVVNKLQLNVILTGTDIQLRDRVSFNKMNADIGYLKSAYLAAFAKLGYVYILRGELDRVRQQIRAPQTKLLELFRLEALSGDNAQKALFLFQSPIRCLGVRIGNVIVCLPHPFDRDEFYEKIPDLRTAGGEATWHSNDNCDWPEKFELALDFSDRYRIIEPHDAPAKSQPM